MYASLAAKLFAALSDDRRETLRRRLVLRELVRRASSKSAWRTLSNGEFCGQPLIPSTRLALERIARSGDRAIRVLGRFHDLQDAAAHNALHVA